jgi:hypothetical protein
MSTFLAVVLIAASQTLYVAKAPTFGCNSSVEVSDLQNIRSDDKAFQKSLYEQIFYGQCVVIEKGKIVVGSIDATDPSMLTVDREILPPGYLSPLADFEVKPDDEKN